MENLQHQRGGLYAIRDNKAGEITGNTLTFKATAVAIRWYTDVLGTPDTITNKHPVDFDLIYLGELNALCAIDAATVPITVLTGQAWKTATDTAAAQLDQQRPELRRA